jgi:2-C-methyl-D-erythritol 4-phosphate cytidylyltransferase
MAAHGHPTVAAILVAAGSGQRLGAAVPKAFAEVGGATLIEHASARFAGHPAITSLLVVAPAAYVGTAAHLAPCVAVPGGETRQASVAAGLAALDDDVEYVLVHDVARPFVPDSVIDSVVAALVGGADAVVPVVAIHDTMRRIEPDGMLAGIVDRDTLVAVQTPQGFRRAVLTDAHTRGANLIVTDDASLVEAFGARVVSVAGADESFKITTPLDLARAEALARSSVPSKRGNP